MARLKSTPSRATKRKIQQRNVRDNLQVKTNKRLRLSNQSERFQSLSNKSSKKKASLAKQSEDANLPPELRKAGLLAHTPIPKGKCFGPFVGKIVQRRKPPDKKHFFVSQVQDNRGNMNYFYARKVEKEKCSWLSRLQSASSQQEQNIAAYNSPAGVCFEALKDISAKEELMASFDESFKGTKCLDENEVVPVSYITDENGKEITVVPLDEAADGSIVYVNPENGNEAEGIEKGLQEDVGEEDGTSDDGDEEEDMETDDDDEEDEDENEDKDDDDDDDDDYVPENEIKLAKVSKRKLVGDNSCDDCSNEGDSEGGCDNDESGLAEDQSSYSKTASRQVKKLSIREITFVDEADGKDSIKYQCSHCLEEFIEKETASHHRASKECLSRVFQCGTCTQEFKNAFSLQKHKCRGKPKCHVCDEEFEEWKQLKAHKKEPPAEHVPKCARCDIQFTSNKEKQYHVRHVHGPRETPQECTICHKSYNKTYLKEHMKTHEESDALKCKECGKVFSSKSNLNKHVKKHAPGYVPLKERRREKKHACSDCDKKFDTLHSLQVHLRSHTGERPFQCDKCEWKFIQKTHLRRHIHSVHEKGEGENVTRRGEGPRNTSVTCEVCQKVYVNHRVLVVHMQSVHLGERPHKCNYCDATYTQRGHLWRHMHASHFDADEVQKKYTGDKFCCNFDGCNEALDTQSDLVEHVRTHTTSKSCMCSQCGATFVSQGNLNKHTRRRHSGRPTIPHKGHSCEMCAKAFPTSYQLQLHFRSHTGEKPYHCDLCGKDFVQKAGLRKHIRCKRCPMIEGPSENPSSVVKKYACEHCEKMFPGPSDLRAHVRSHTGERPYQCNYCQKGFSQPGNLTKHIKYIHEKQKRPKEKAREKKYFCSLCGKAFLCPSSLAMHCRTHSGHKPFSCEQCGQAFAQAGNLKKHVKRWHEDGAGPWRRGVNKRKHEKKSKGIRATGSDLDTSEFEPRVYSDLDAENDRTEATDTQDTRSTSDLTLAVPSAAYMNMSEGSCTPLNSLGVFVGTTPLNTPVTSGTNGGTVQRQPVVISFAGDVVNGSPQEAPLCEGAEREGTGRAEQSKKTPTDEHNAAAATEAKGMPRLSASPLTPQHQNLYAPAVSNLSAATQSPNVNTMAAQQLQQLALSRAFPPVTGVDSVFLPPNVAGPAVSAPSTILPQVQSILNPAMSATLTGVTPSTVLMAPTLGSDMTIFSFSPSNFFQQ